MAQVRRICVSVGPLVARVRRTWLSAGPAKVRVRRTRHFFGPAKPRVRRSKDVSDSKTPAIRRTLPPTAPPANGAWLAAMTRADNVLGIPVFSVIFCRLLTFVRMPRPSHAAAAKTERSRVSVPGILADTVRQRFLQFRYPGLSPSASNRADWRRRDRLTRSDSPAAKRKGERAVGRRLNQLICFDLRLRVPHEPS